MLYIKIVPQRSNRSILKYILHLLNTRLKHIDAKQIFEILLKLSIMAKRSFTSRSQIIENKQSIALFLN